MASASSTAAPNTAASNTAAFLIFHREKSGKSDRIFSYEDDEAIYILAATNICRELLKLEKSRQAFKEIAQGFKDENLVGCWYKNWNMEDVVNKFIEMMLELFPWLFSDDGMPNPGLNGCHYRRDYDKFFTRKQAICLNGSRVRDMCAAAEKAKKSNDLNSKEHKQYRTFIFNFATTLFHELGHVFITFLSLGKKTTPKKFKRELVGEPKESIKPEAGSTLERMVFGGSVVCARNDEYDERQSGAPHLATKDDIGQISQEAIDEFVRCNFKFPFMMGRPLSTPLKWIGRDLNPYTDMPGDPIDPARWPETRELAENHSSIPLDFDDWDSLEPALSAHPKVSVGSQSALAKIVFQPELQSTVHTEVAKQVDEGAGSGKGKGGEGKETGSGKGKGKGKGKA